MNYTLNQLRIFHRVAQTGSVTRAAKELYLTQPAVSIQLKNFQDQFELPLFEIVHKRIHITEFGREIEEAAERILDEVHAINFRMHAYKGHLTGKLKLSVVSTGKYIAPFLLADFINAHSGLELEMDVTNKFRVVKTLEQNTVDFALVSVLPNHLDIEKVELMQNQLVLVGNGDSSYTDESYDHTIFEEIPLIFREKGSGTRVVMEEYLKSNQITVINRMELTSNEAVKQAVIAGLGYSVMPLIGIRNELNDGFLKVIPMKQFPLSSTWHLIWLRKKKLSPAASAFLEFIQENKEEVIQKWFLGNRKR